MLASYLRKSKRKGIVLLTSLFFMMVFFLLSFALYQLSPTESRSAARDKTLTEAHFSCTAGLRLAKEWISAVSKPGTSTSDIDGLGGVPETFTTSAGRTYKVPVLINGSPAYLPTANNDVFSVPDTDPNFYLDSLGNITTPSGFSGLAGKTGVDYLGLKPDTNLTSLDYTNLKAQQANWLCLKTKGNVGLQVGDFRVFTYIVPSADTMQQLTGTVSLGLRSYLVTTMAYKSGFPVMRARCLLKEQSAADYAYRSNKGGYDIMGNPVAWNVVNQNTVLFDGPVHTNDVPFINVPLSYWTSSLVASSEPGRPKRAIMGSLTFSGTNTTLQSSAYNFDGVGYLGGNYNGTSPDRRPFDDSGAPVPVSGAGYAAANINNRYDRMIEGGRQSIRKVATAPLPADLVVLKSASWGADSVTGLSTTDPNPANWQVNPNQLNGSVQATTVTQPGYTNSSGTWVPPVNRTNTANEGIFVNPKSGTSETAGGIAIKGNTRNMYLEVQDSSGNLITNVSALETGSVTGNPVVRVQSTVDSYDSNSGTLQQTYTVTPGTPTYVPGSAGTWNPPVYRPPAAGYTTPGYTSGYVAASTTPGYTTGGGGPVHSPVTTCPLPTYTPPSAAGSAIGTYSCPHTYPLVWNPPAYNPGSPGTWRPPVWNAPTGGYTTPGYTSGASAGYTSPGTPTITPTGNVTIPAKYKAQDWVVDVKNVATTIPASPPDSTFSTSGGIYPTGTPTGAAANAWQTGLGAQLSPGAAQTKQAPVPGVLSGGATPDSQGVRYYVHDNNSASGVLQTTARTVPVGKVLLYKQSRSDMNRVDVFVLDRPPLTPAQAALPVIQQPGGTNGAVFATGDITNLRGVNMGAKSIGVDYSTNKGLSIVDNVWQYGTVRGAKPTTPTHGLGLVATKMNVQTRANDFASASASLYIYATMIAGSSAAGNTGGLDVSQVNDNELTDFTRVANSTNTSAANRSLKIFGGLTEQMTKARLDGSRGWDQTMNFDKQLSYQPPPFFPSTNVLVPLAYVQESIMGQ